MNAALWKEEPRQAKIRQRDPCGFCALLNQEHQRYEGTAVLAYSCLFLPAHAYTSKSVSLLKSKYIWNFSKDCILGNGFAGGGGKKIFVNS